MEEQRMNWRISRGVYGIHWEDVDAITLQASYVRRGALVVFGLRYNICVSEATRKLRAKERRARAVISRQRFGDTEVETLPIYGVEAMSLVTRLTKEAWSLSGRALPDYNRANTSYRFVKGFPE